MNEGNGRASAPDKSSELPASLDNWMAVEAVVGETLDALRARDDAEHAVAFLTHLHRGVRVWLAFEFWAALYAPGEHTPDSLLEALLERGVDARRVFRDPPAMPPRPGRGVAWRAFEDDDDAQS